VCLDFRTPHRDLPVVDERAQPSNQLDELFRTTANSMLSSVLTTPKTQCAVLNFRIRFARCSPFRLPASRMTCPSMHEILPMRIGSWIDEHANLTDRNRAASFDVRSKHCR